MVCRNLSIDRIPVTGQTPGGTIASMRRGPLLESIFAKCPAAEKQGKQHHPQSRPWQLCPPALYRPEVAQAQAAVRLPHHHRSRHGQRLDECLSFVHTSCSNLLPFESTAIVGDGGITMDDDGILHLLQLPDRGR